MADIFEIVGRVSLDGIDRAERELNNFTDTGEKSSSKLSKFGSVAKGIGKGLLIGTGAVVTGAVGLVKQVSSSYGALQQSIGGIETLFGESAQKVIDNANNAFKTAGMSANDYMQQVTSFSASLLQSLGGDTEEASKSADMAIRDMSDNANKMGTSMEMITNAYQGFAKQNYTMLDNLKLGYGGTKSEMERLLADAEKISGIKYDISNLNDVYSAIHVIQGELGITGTTAKEAGATIEGSFGSLSAAWANFIAGLGNPAADMKKIIDDLAKSISGAITNVTPIIENMVAALPTVVSSLVGAIEDLLPTLIETFTSLIKEVINAIIELLPTAIPLILDCILTVAESVIDVLPELIDAIIQLFSELISKLSEMLPTLIPTIIDAVVQIANSLVENAPTLINAIVELVNQLATAFTEALPQLIDAIPPLLQSLVDSLLENLPTLIQGIVQLVLGIVNALPDIITAFTDATPLIISMIVEALISCLPDLIMGCIQLVLGIVAALPNILSALVKSLPAAFKGIWDGVKKGVANIDVWFGTKFGDAKVKIVAAWSDIKEKFGQKWNDIKSVFSAIGDWFSEKFKVAKNLAISAWDGVKAVFSGIYSGIKNVFSSVGSWFGEKFTEAKNKAVNAWSNIKNKFSEIKEKITSAFSDIKERISAPFEKARDAVKGVVDRIKGFFNFKITFPHIPLPHFSVSPPGWSVGDLLKGKIPSLGISWYAKAIAKPMLLTKPTAFGYDEESGTVRAGGEAGNEVVSGASTLMNMISNAVSMENNPVVYCLQQLTQVVSDFFPQLITAIGQVPDIQVDKTIENVVTEDPVQKYQFEFNNQFNILTDSVERLISLIGEYLPEITNGLDRPIVLDSDAMAVGISQKIDRELGKRKLSKGRGNV